MDAEAVRQQVPAAKRFGVCDHLVELQPDRRVVGGDDGAGADADNGVQRHAVPHELLEDPGVRGAAQASGAEHDTDAHAFLLARARILRSRAHLFIGRSRRDERNLGGSCSMSRTRNVVVPDLALQREGACARRVAILRCVVVIEWRREPL